MVSGRNEDVAMELLISLKNGNGKESKEEVMDLDTYLEAVVPTKDFFISA